MKLKKRIVIVADIICDEDFDCNELLIAQDVSIGFPDYPRAYVGRGEDDEWKVLNYAFQESVVLSDEV